MGSSLREQILLTYQFDEYVTDKPSNRRNAPPMVAIAWQGDGSYAPVIETIPQRLGPGQLLSVDRATTQFDSGAGDTDINPLLSLRMDASDGDGWHLVPEHVTIWIDANVACRVGLYLDPVIGGTDAAVWTDVPNSHGNEGTDPRVQYDRTRNNTNPITADPGTQIWTRYGHSVDQVLNFDVRGLAYPLEQGEELVLGAQNVIAAANSYLAAIQFRLMKNP